MLGSMITGRTSYRRALGMCDPAAILAALSDDVTIRVAFHDEPLRGQDTAGFLVFGSVCGSFTPVRGRSPAAAGRLSGLVMNVGGRW
jgi:hypothetical protein